MVSSSSNSSSLQKYSTPLLVQSDRAAILKIKDEVMDDPNSETSSQILTARPTFLRNGHRMRMLA